MLRDSIGDRSCFAVVQGVIAADGALQLRKLSDHVGREIRLGEHRRTVSQRGIRAGEAGDATGNDAYSRDAVELCAQLVVIDDRSETRNPCFEPLFSILVVEELGVGEARAQHSFVAVDDRRRILGIKVAHQQEPVPEPPRLVCEREILLVPLHGENQALLRYIEERPVKGTGVDGRPLD